MSIVEVGLLSKAKQTICNRETHSYYMFSISGKQHHESAVLKQDVHISSRRYSLTFVFVQ